MSLQRATFVMLLILLFYAQLVYSHHNSAFIYDVSRTVTIEGIVVNFRLVNPHAMLTINVIDDTGKHVTWTIEMAGKLAISKLGWEDDSISLGERVMVTGNPARSGSTKMWFSEEIIMADGTELLAQSSGRLKILEKLRQQRRKRLRDQQN